MTEREFLQIMSVMAQKIDSMEMYTTHLLERNAHLETENAALRERIDRMEVAAHE